MIAPVLGQLSRWLVASTHQAVEKKSSRKLGFRCTEFSETQYMSLSVLINPICRGNTMRSGPVLFLSFRQNSFSETRRLRRHKKSRGIEARPVRLYRF